MKTGLSLHLVAFIVSPAVALASGAQEPPPQTDAVVVAAAVPAPTPAAQAAPPPAPATVPAQTAPAPLPAEPAKPDDISIKASGWLILNTYLNRGSFDGTEQPRFLMNRTSRDDAAGMMAKQTRLRLAVNVPSSKGLLGSAALKGFVESDFAGAGSELSGAPVPRLRHAWASATWKDLGNLTFLVGQNWSLLQGASTGLLPESIGHITTPRFAGAGSLARRAPQVRVQGDVPTGGPVGVNYVAAAMSNFDPEASSTVAGSPSAGARGGMPDFEARVGVFYTRRDAKLVEVGVSGHYGRERYILEADGGRDQYLSSEAVAIDLKVDLPYLSLMGSAIRGANLDSSAAASPGVRRTNVTEGSVTRLQSIHSVRLQGAFAQLLTKPFYATQLMLGAGIELPEKGDLPANARFWRNRQLASGVIVNLSKRWKVALEHTRYITDTLPTPSAPGATLTGNQFELGTLLAL